MRKKPREIELEVRAQVRVDRAHLEQAHRAFDEGLVDHVERGDRRDVAGAEHQRHAPLRIATFVETGLRVSEVLRFDARLEPRLRTKRRVQQRVVALVRRHADRKAPVRERLQTRRLDARRAQAPYLVERVRELLQVALDWHQPREPLFPFERRA
jgi:hypothetical protein